MDWYIVDQSRKVIAEIDSLQAAQRYIARYSESIPGLLIKRKEEDNVLSRLRS